MLRRFFDPEKGIWYGLGVLGDLLMLSMLWAVCCIPVLTVGSSTAALYDTAVHALRRKDDALLTRFFRTFKRELLSGALSTLLWAAVLLAEFGGYRLLQRALGESAARPAALIFYLVLLGFFTLCVLAWVFPTLSRFTFRTGALNATALRLAFGHILRSAGLAILIGGSGYLSFRFGLPIMVLPGLAAYLATFLIEPVFRQYEPQDCEE
jgi:uncharacterized membrane protein YesL